ncbi:YbaB/EbfC family nucleoid-associated protein [Actinomadura flavalba]|uniref:YbaB/EbfC family nucleoid-associated protein n=1 Tax=Actinomadura flavalba TaxID=1120938 RepID=UPI00035EB412|nr:YbaB/EbfC family nucleoid-associated protein [Actinomadura flavalba]
MADLSGNDLDRMLTDARRTLEAMRSGRQAPGADAPVVEGVGEAADGRVRVTAVTGGRLTSVDLDPRALRMASHELGEALVQAANAALDELRGKAAGAAADEAVDTEALGKRVEEIQNESLRQMQMISQALTDTVNKIGQRR